MDIQIQNGVVTFDGVQKTPTNNLLSYYIEKLDFFSVNIELSGTSYFYAINDITLNGVTYDVAEGFIINYYNLINNI